MREFMTLLRSVVAGSTNREQVEFYPDEEIDWDLIRGRIDLKADPCVEAALVIKDHLVVDKGYHPDDLKIMSVRHGDTPLHSWVEYKGQVIDKPEIRRQARRGLLNIYRRGRRDMGGEELYDNIMENGFSRDLRRT